MDDLFGDIIAKEISSRKRTLGEGEEGGERKRSIKRSELAAKEEALYLKEEAEAKAKRNARRVGSCPVTFAISTY
jgi:hypothetical protein